MTDSASMSLWTVLPSSLTYIATVTVGDVYYPFAYTGQTLAFPAARMPVYGQVDVAGTAGQDMVVGTLDYHRYALGEGNDLFITGSGPEWVDMGPGDDLVYLTSNQDFYDVVMLGAGRDLIVPVQTVGAMAASRRHIIKDFQPGPDGDRIAIHAEDAVCEDLSSDVMRVGRGGRARGALGALVQDAEAFERVHQKGSGSAGRVENAQAVQGIVGRGREQERRGRVVERIGGEIWKCRVQGIADDLIDEGGWGVECARPSALVGGHE